MVAPNFSGDAPLQSTHSEKLNITAREAMILVHELTAHTVGGVIGESETIMQIVPRADELVVEAKVAPQDIDQVASVAEAVVHIMAGNQRTTPVITGSVTRVSANITREAEPEDLSGNLIVQLGAATEELNRSWYERNTGRCVSDVQRQVKHSAILWMAATLDGVVEATGAVFEAKFMLPWSFSEEAAAEKYMPQVQHNMWVTHLRTSVLSIITGGGKWVEITVPMDPLYLSVLVSAEKKFWRCVQSGEPPYLINAEPPRPRIEAVRIVDMNSSNSWAEFAALFRNTRSAFLDHERAKSELKALMPEDAREAIGHGVKAKRSKSGAVSFDVLETEATHAPLQ
jgi:hypothetical protein